MCCGSFGSFVRFFEQRNEASDGDGAIAGNRKMRDG